jgi:ribose/xylose/arabinose/galactoside ABC-type transport system permease subunit
LKTYHLATLAVTKQKTRLQVSAFSWSSVTSGQAGVISGPETGAADPDSGVKLHWQLIVFVIGWLAVAFVIVLVP